MVSQNTIVSYGNGTGKHYCMKKWLLEEQNISDKKNVVTRHQLTKQKYIYLLFNNSKLGLIKQFVKEIDKDSEGFKYLIYKFPHMNEAKIKEFFQNFK